MQLLSSDERQRAERFVRPRDRDAFISARGVLRLVLSRYLELQPAALQFCYGAHGKPALKPELNPDQVCFNVSHTAGLAVYAVALDQELGIDLEQVRSNLDYQAIAGRFFSPLENTMLQSLSAQEQCPAFFRAWTRKEAYVKAVGRGLALHLDQFSVSLKPDQPAALLAVEGDCQGEAERWFLWEIDAAAGYMGALAAQRQCSLSYWQWLDEN